MNETGLTIREQDLINNPTPRVPVCVVLDCSGSMSGDPIEELRVGVEKFIKELADNEYAKDSAEICVVIFGGHVECLLNFDHVERQSQNIPLFSASGGTPMDQAVNMALDKLQERKQEYKNNGVEYYQPWMVLMTDGQPTENIDNSTMRTQELVNNNKLTVFPLGMGDQADMNELARYSPKRNPLKLKGLCFSEFFEWLSKSVEKVSQSIPGDKIDLDIDGIKEWATL
jgi:uncharacterized protein YegL